MLNLTWSYVEKKNPKDSKLETNDFTIRYNSAFYSKINIIVLNMKDRGKY